MGPARIGHRYHKLGQNGERNHPPPFQFAQVLQLRAPVASLRLPQTEIEEARARVLQPILPARPKVNHIWLQAASSPNSTQKENQGSEAVEQRVQTKCQNAAARIRAGELGLWHWVNRKEYRACPWLAFFGLHCPQVLLAAWGCRCRPLWYF